MSAKVPKPFELTRRMRQAPLVLDRGPVEPLAAGPHPPSQAACYFDVGGPDIHPMWSAHDGCWATFGPFEAGLASSRTNLGTRRFGP